MIFDFFYRQLWVVGLNEGGDDRIVSIDSKAPVHD